MATIPMGGFDAPRVTPEASNNRADPGATNVAGRGSQALGAAIVDAGHDVARVGAQQAAEEKRQADALAKAKAANADSAYELEVRAVAADVEDQLRRSGDYTKADALYEEAANKIQPPEIDGLPPESLVAYQGSIANRRRAGKLMVQNMVVSARRDDGQRQFGTALDLAGKTAGQPGADVEAVNERLRKSEEFYIAGFGLDRSVTGKAIQDRIDANWTNQAAQRFNASNEDPEALQQLLHDVTTEDGYYAGKLDADKRNVIAARIGSRIDVLQNKAERAQDKVDTIAEKALGAIDEQLSSGVPATIEQWSSWADTFKVASPERRAEFLQRVEDEKEVQSFLRMPIDEQLAGLQTRQAELYTKGGDKGDRANFARIKSAVEGNVKLLKETPLQFAQAREGEKIEPLSLNALGDPSQVGVLTAQLQQRAVLVAGLRKKYGPQVQNRILLPQESSMVVSMLDKLPPVQLVNLFGGLRRASGSADNYAAIMQQIAPDAPIKAYAGELSARPGGEQVAMLMLNGEEVLNPKEGATKMKMPPESNFQAALTAEVGTAYQGRPEEFTRDLAAVRAVYAGSAARDGVSKAGDEFDPKLASNAIRAVVGNVTEFGGRKVVAPWGMPAIEFSDRAEQLIVDRLRSIGTDDVSGVGLMATPRPGVYVLTRGRSPIEDPTAARPDGKPRPLFIDLTGYSPSKEDREGLQQAAREQRRGR